MTKRSHEGMNEDDEGAQYRSDEESSFSFPLKESSEPGTRNTGGAPSHVTFSATNTDATDDVGETKGPFRGLKGFANTTNAGISPSPSLNGTSNESGAKEKFTFSSPMTTNNSLPKFTVGSFGTSALISAKKAKLLEGDTTSSDKATNINAFSFGLKPVETNRTNNPTSIRTESCFLDGKVEDKSNTTPPTFGGNILSSDINKESEKKPPALNLTPGSTFFAYTTIKPPALSVIPGESGGQSTPCNTSKSLPKFTVGSAKKAKLLEGAATSSDKATKTNALSYGLKPVETNRTNNPTSISTGSCFFGGKVEEQSRSTALTFGGNIPSSDNNKEREKKPIGVSFKSEEGGRKSAQYKTSTSLPKFKVGSFGTSALISAKRAKLLESAATSSDKATKTNVLSYGLKPVETNRTNNPSSIRTESCFLGGKVEKQSRSTPLTFGRNIPSSDNNKEPEKKPIDVSFKSEEGGRKSAQYKTSTSLPKFTVGSFGTSALISAKKAKLLEGDTTSSDKATNINAFSFGLKPVETNRTNNPTSIRTESCFLDGKVEDKSNTTPLTFGGNILSSDINKESEKKPPALNLTPGSTFFAYTTIKPPALSVIPGESGGQSTPCNTSKSLAKFTVGSAKKAKLLEGAATSSDKATKTNALSYGLKPVETNRTNNPTSISTGSCFFGGKVEEQSRSTALTFGGNIPSSDNNKEREKKPIGVSFKSEEGGRKSAQYKTSTSLPKFKVGSFGTSALISAKRAKLLESAATSSDKATKTNVLSYGLKPVETNRTNNPSSIRTESCFLGGKVEKQSRSTPLTFGRNIPCSDNNKEPEKKPIDVSFKSEEGGRKSAQYKTSTSLPKFTVGSFGTSALISAKKAKLLEGDTTSSDKATNINAFSFGLKPVETNRTNNPTSIRTESCFLDGKVEDKSNTTPPTFGGNILSSDINKESEKKPPALNLTPGSTFFAYTTIKPPALSVIPGESGGQSTPCNTSKSLPKFTVGSAKKAKLLEGAATSSDKATKTNALSYGLKPVETNRTNNPTSISTGSCFFGGKVEEQSRSTALTFGGNIPSSDNNKEREKKPIGVSFKSEEGGRKSAQYKTSTSLPKFTVGSFGTSALISAKKAKLLEGATTSSDKATKTNAPNYDLKPVKTNRTNNPFSIRTESFFFGGKVEEQSRSTPLTFGRNIPSSDNNKEREKKPIDVSFKSEEGGRKSDQYKTSKSLPKFTVGSFGTSALISAKKAKLLEGDTTSSDKATKTNAFSFGLKPVETNRTNNPTSIRTESCFLDGKVEDKSNTTPPTFGGNILSSDINKESEKKPPALNLTPGSTFFAYTTIKPPALSVIPGESGGQSTPCNTSKSLPKFTVGSAKKAKLLEGAATSSDKATKTNALSYGFKPVETNRTNNPTSISTGSCFFGGKVEEQSRSTPLTFGRNIPSSDNNKEPEKKPIDVSFKSEEGGGKSDQYKTSTSLPKFTMGSFGTSALISAKKAKLLEGAATSSDKATKTNALSYGFKPVETYRTNNPSSIRTESCFLGGKVEKQSSSIPPTFGGNIPCSDNNKKSEMKALDVSFKSEEGGRKSAQYKTSTSLPKFKVGSFGTSALISAKKAKLLEGASTSSDKATKTNVFSFGLKPVETNRTNNPTSIRTESCFFGGKVEEQSRSTPLTFGRNISSSDNNKEPEKKPIDVSFKSDEGGRKSAQYKTSTSLPKFTVGSFGTSALISAKKAKLLEGAATSSDKTTKTNAFSFGLKPVETNRTNNPFSIRTESCFFGGKVEEQSSSTRSTFGGNIPCSDINKKSEKKPLDVSFKPGAAPLTLTDVKSAVLTLSLDDVKESKQKHAVYSKICKVFIRTDGKYADHGLGRLYLKPIKASGKTQLIVRAATDLWNALVNYVVSEDILMKRVGERNVLVVAVSSATTPIVLRLKTIKEADELLANLEKYKK